MDFQLLGDFRIQYECEVEYHLLILVFAFITFPARKGEQNSITQQNFPKLKQVFILLRAPYKPM